MSSMTSREPTSFTSRSKVSTLSRRPVHDCLPLPRYTLALQVLGLCTHAAVAVSVAGHSMPGVNANALHGALVIVSSSPAADGAILFPCPDLGVHSWDEASFMAEATGMALRFASMAGARLGPPASASAPLTTCTFSASAFSMAATLQAQ